MSALLDTLTETGAAILIVAMLIVLLLFIVFGPRPQTGAYCMIQPDGKPDYTRCVTLVPTATDAR